MVELFLTELGLDIRSILVPKEGIDLKKWAVIACDQYTSEPEYWQNVDKLVGDAPSTLHLIFPEVYLERESYEEKQNRIKNINRQMCDYLDKGYFSDITNSMIYVERTTCSGKTRRGLITAIDLENYDYSQDSKSLIRSTEGTILDRLPPRIQIRKNACLEVPHVMVLIDDPERGTIEALASHKEKMRKLYSFDLIMNGGHIEGYQVSDKALLEEIYRNLISLKSDENFYKKYGVDSSYSPLLFAVGDGNHSLATAKSCWEQLKTSLNTDERKNHPARFALVELVNVHDTGLEFEPIHRLLFNVNPQNLLSAFIKFYAEKGIKCGYEYVTALSNVPENQPSHHIIPFVYGLKRGFMWVDNPSFTLDVATLQCFLDDYLKNNPGVGIDYIHSADVIQKLSMQDGNMGFILSPMNKRDLFKTVILDGALPRKTFSMGEADEKRFYLECRALGNINIR